MELVGIRLRGQTSFELAESFAELQNLMAEQQGSLGKIGKVSGPAEYTSGPLSRGDD